MPTTYTLISSNVLTSSAASVTFSSIPATYTDLVLRISARGSGVSSNALQVYIQANGDSANNYSTTILLGNSSTVSSFSFAPDSAFIYFYIPQSGSTANTFSNNEIYIPSYTAGQNKPASGFGVAENNSSSANQATIDAAASLYRSNTAISSLSIGGANFVSGSSFYLYGISSN